MPRAVIELTSILILHRMTSPQWLKHLKSAITSLEAAIRDISARSALDPTRAAIQLGWRPWTSLDEGVGRVFDWLKHPT